MKIRRLLPVSPLSSMQNDWLLLITQDDSELAMDQQALIEAGYDDACIIALHADEATSLLLSRNHHAGQKRPGLIIVDLDHSSGEDRERLKRLVKSLKEEDDLRPIPVLLLMRHNKMEDVRTWYRAGVNACAVRPDSLPNMIDFYRSTRTFWRERVVLPDWQWP